VHQPLQQLLLPGLCQIKAGLQQLQLPLCSWAHNWTLLAVLLRTLLWFLLLSCIAARFGLFAA
jgi:hypothetical protein